MDKVKELKIRFDEAKKIYGDSPGVTVTFKDLQRVYDDLQAVLDIADKKEGIGFK